MRVLIRLCKLIGICFLSYVEDLSTRSFGFQVHLDYYVHIIFAPILRKTRTDHVLFPNLLLQPVVLCGSNNHKFRPPTATVAF